MKRESSDGTAADDRTTSYVYNWQDELIETINPADNEGRVTYTYNTYDNLGNVTETQTFLEATPNDPQPGTDQLLTQENTFYNTQGQVYQTEDWQILAPARPHPIAATWSCTPPRANRPGTSTGRPW